jgi:glycosyltransferase involved in cell wall biosynthesis
VDLFICPSTFLENKLLSAKKFYKGKTKTIHNFIDKNKFSSCAEHPDSYIVFVGRLSAEKGVKLLAETAKLMPEYTFVVAGSGPDEKELHGIDNIKLAGFLTGKQLTELMGNAKVLLLPSVCYENCPLSILESHCMGVPVVTMNYGGMAELVKDGITGSLVNDASPEAIASKLKEMLENEDYYNGIRKNCSNEKDNIFSIETYCDVLIKEYEKLVKR